MIFEPAAEVKIKIKEVLEKAGKMPAFSIVEFLEMQLDVRRPK